MKTQPLLRLDSLPVLQNKVYPNPEAAMAAARGNLLLQQHPLTGVVSNVDFEPGLLRYDQDYQNEQACSPSFRRHLNEVMAILRKCFKQSSVVEIGCGKGFFLEQLIEAGFDAVGVDPAYEGSRACVIRAPFTRELGISAPGLVMRHVLEHIPDPFAFLESVAQANGGVGTIYIEVPCFDWICAHRAWFDVFYEHVNYFRASDFERFFGNVLETGHLFGGQYLYVVAELASLRHPLDPGPRALLPPDFMDGADRCRELALETGGALAIWGASSKGVLFAHHLRNSGLRFHSLIDINPVKQGKFAAGTGLPILSPEAAVLALPRGTSVFVMNSNYHDEISARSGGAFRLINADDL